MKYLFGIVLCVFLLFGLSWVVLTNDTAQQKVFAPRQEAIRRETFEQSKAYQQGMIQELQNMQFEYVKADTAGKKAMRSIILHRAADFNADVLPPDLRSFIDGLRHQQTGS